MNILITGAKGFVGRNLTQNLKNIRDGKNRTRPNIQIEEVYEYDIDSTQEVLDEYCAKTDFVFNLAGVNRPENPEEFREGNFGFASVNTAMVNNPFDKNKSQIKPAMSYNMNINNNIIFEKDEEAQNSKPKFG